MRILVLGSGAREHALCYALQKSPQTSELFAMPGNPGISQIATCLSGNIEDNTAVVQVAKEKAIDLVVVGPEVPLVNGVADALEAAGIKVFGPSQKAAELEGSKAFSKDLMKKYGIPTASYEIFTDAAAAKAYVATITPPVVIKADGLAAGKGVIIAETTADALAAIDEIMLDRAFGDSGSQVVIEEFMQGEEVSVLCFTDGKTIIPMLPSQDHKRALDGDQGLNTGGMGAYAPAPVGTAELLERVQAEILEPTIKAMAQEGRLYKGCLYAGLMVTATGPKVVEFNCRFGDPEAEVVLPLLDSDLVEIMLSIANDNLTADLIRWKDEVAVAVILAAGGYPKSYAKGDAIEGLDTVKDALIFQAGTKENAGKLVTNGGRVLAVVACGSDIAGAVHKVYQEVAKIKFANMHYRKDIAHLALNR